MAPKKNPKSPKTSPEIPQGTLSEYEVSQSQLAFFFLPEVPGKEQKYSHLMDLYDAIPRFHWGRVSRQKDEDGKYLPRQTLPARSLEFIHRKRRYSMVQIPARIILRDDNNKVIEEWEYYPQVREEIIEDTLRKMAAEGSGAFFRKKAATEIEEQTGVVFSIYSLQQVLAKHGHHYSYNEIKEALLILRRTSISIYDESGDQMMEANIFTALGLSEKNGRGHAFVLFNPLVTRSIQARTFRQYNYQLAMGLKYALSRWLYKKLCFNYTQASRLHPYTIKLSSILRDSQLKAYAKISNNIREVEKTFEELKDNAVLDRFEDERIYDPDRRNKIADVKYTLFPHEDFIKDMRRFNEAYGSQKEKEKQVNFVGDEY